MTRAHALPALLCSTALAVAGLTACAVSHAARPAAVVVDAPPQYDPWDVPDRPARIHIRVHVRPSAHFAIQDPDNFDCPEGRCEFRCPSGASCNASCDGGRCDFTCEPGASCNFQCDGGHCDTVCAEGASCNTECDGGHCDTACAEGASCNTECDGGHCG